MEKIIFRRASRVGGHEAFYVVNQVSGSVLFLHWNGSFKDWAIITKLDDDWSPEQLETIRAFIRKLNTPEPKGNEPGV